MALHDPVELGLNAAMHFQHPAFALEDDRLGDAEAGQIDGPAGDAFAAAVCPQAALADALPLRQLPTK